MADEMLTAAEIRALCGDIEDWQVQAIEALGPTAGDVAAAVAWVGGQDELGQEGRPLEGMAAQVYDVLITEAAYGEER